MLEYLLTELSKIRKLFFQRQQQSEIYAMDELGEQVYLSNHIQQLLKRWKKAIKAIANCHISAINTHYNTHII